MSNPVRKLLFVDTNVWLDFYRARSDAGLALLEKAEAVSDRIIVTYQLESEFKKNRQAAIFEGIQELKAPTQIPRPGLFSDAKATTIMNRSLKEAAKRVKDLRTRFIRALDNPSAYDPVYQACQRVFHKEDDLVLTREDKIRHTIRRRAFRRFLHGCPPRKKTDTSLGDAFNWEWIIDCADRHKADVVIVSRDTDFGIVIDDKAYINDHLKQEFTERVSKKRKVTLINRLSEALKHFQVPISKQVEDAEAEIVRASAGKTAEGDGWSQDFYAALRALEAVPSQPNSSYAEVLKGIQINNSYAEMLKSIQIRNPWADMFKSIESIHPFAEILKTLTATAGMEKKINGSDASENPPSDPPAPDTSRDS